MLVSMGGIYHFIRQPTLKPFGTGLKAMRSQQPSMAAASRRQAAVIGYADFLFFFPFFLFPPYFYLSLYFFPQLIPFPPLIFFYFIF